MKKCFGALQPGDYFVTRRFGKNRLFEVKAPARREQEIFTLLSRTQSY